MKTIIYQILPRLWGDGRLLSSIADEAFLNYLRSLKVTHLWLTGIIRHSRGQDYVKGDPGSPYSIIDYYDINPYLCTADTREGRLKEFREVLEYIHGMGIKVLIDFVPNHVSPDYDDPHGGIPVCLYHDYDWTDTVKINYSDSRTCARMTDIVNWWASQGVDGFRCDMVEMVPCDFFRIMIQKVKETHPELLFIGEAYQEDHYGDLFDAGFDLLYDKSGMYDTLKSVVKGWADTSALNRCWQSLGAFQSRMLNFLENHDEVRYASAEFAGRADRMAAVAVSALFNRNPFMLYFGQEIGLDASESSNCRTSIFDFTHPEGLGRLWRHIHGDASLMPQEESLLEKYREIMAMAASELYSEGENYDLSYCNLDYPRVFPFLRILPGRAELVLACFGDVPDRELKIPVQMPGELTVKVFKG